MYVYGSSSAKAGLMSGSPGIESVPGPELPKIEFLDRFNAKNQKFYAENDARFKESPLLKKLLENSKLNKEKNAREIQEKYCLRGTKWGVGDCSTTGMTDEEKEKFITMLKKKTGIEYSQESMLIVKLSIQIQMEQKTKTTKILCNQTGFINLGF